MTRSLVQFVTCAAVGWAARGLYATGEATFSSLLSFLDLTFSTCCGFPCQSAAIVFMSDNSLHGASDLQCESKE